MHGCSPAPSCFLYLVSARAGMGQVGSPRTGFSAGKHSSQGGGYEEAAAGRRSRAGQGRACCPPGMPPDPRSAPGGCAALPGRSAGDKEAASAGRSRGGRCGGAGALRPGGRKTGRGVRGGERGGRLGPAEKEGSPGSPHPRSCPAGVPQHGAVLAELAGQRGEQAPLPGRGGPGGVPSAGLTRGGGSGEAGGRWQAAGPARGAWSRRGAGVPACGAGRAGGMCSVRSPVRAWQGWMRAGAVARDSARVPALPSSHTLCLCLVFVKLCLGKFGGEEAASRRSSSFFLCLFVVVVVVVFLLFFESLECNIQLKIWDSVLYGAALPALGCRTTQKVL